MKLNNGKGWEAIKSHPSHGHLNHNNVPNSSARELHGANRASKTPLPPGRLEADLPKPGASRQGQPGAGQRHQSGRRDHYSQDYAKRRSNGGDLAAPEGSTAAQFANSSGNLPATRMSASQTQTQQTPTPNRQSTTTGPQAGAGVTRAQTQTQQQQQAQDQKPGAMQKILKVLCCG